MKNIYTLLIILFYLLRVFLSISTYHQDLGAMALSGKYISVENKWFSFYDQSGKDASQTIFNYQPLAYLVPSIVYLPFRSIIAPLGDAYKNSDWQIDNHGNTSIFLLIYKLPMLLADLGVLILIGKLFSDIKSKNLARLLWAVNPITIFVSSIIGQVDVIIAFFLLLSFYFFKNKKIATAIIFVILSALIKPIGLILLPIIGYQSIKKFPPFVMTALYTAFGLLLYIASIVPYLGSSSFKHYALFADQISKSTAAGISIAPGHVIPWFFVSYAIVLMLYFGNKIDKVSALILALLSSLVFTHFHPQWLVWVIPLLIYQSVSTKNYQSLFIITTAWLVILFSFDDTLLLGSFVNNSWHLPTIVRENNLFTIFVQLARAFLVGNFFWLFYSLTTKDRAQN